MTDFLVRHEGSIILLVPLTPDAQKWVDAHIARGDSFQPCWPVAVVEPRYINDILNGIRADSLTYKLGTAKDDV